MGHCIAWEGLCAQQPMQTEAGACTHLQLLGMGEMIPAVHAVTFVVRQATGTPPVTVWVLARRWRAGVVGTQPLSPRLCGGHRP
jgi:hypothetical protein